MLLPKPALPGSHRSYRLMGQTKILPPPSVVPIAVGLCPPQADCQPLLDDGPSRRYLYNPYMSAWTLTPQCFLGALTRFFPKNIGLTLDLRRSAHQTASAMQLQQSTLFRGCSHFVMFRLSCLLDPQVAPTAETQWPQGGQAVYTTQWTCGFPT